MLVENHSVGFGTPFRKWKESSFCPVMAENMSFLPTNNRSTRQLKKLKQKNWYAPDVVNRFSSFFLLLFFFFPFTGTQWGRGREWVW
jgi:hypothetical protein